MCLYVEKKTGRRVACGGVLQRIGGESLQQLGKCFGEICVKMCVVFEGSLAKGSCE